MATQLTMNMPSLSTVAHSGGMPGSTSLPISIPIPTEAIRNTGVRYHEQSSSADGRHLLQVVIDLGGGEAVQGLLAFGGHVPGHTLLGHQQYELVPLRLGLFSWAKCSRRRSTTDCPMYMYGWEE